MGLSNKSKEEEMSNTLKALAETVAKYVDLDVAADRVGDTTEENGADGRDMATDNHQYKAFTSPDRVMKHEEERKVEKSNERTKDVKESLLIGRRRDSVDYE